MNQRGVAYYMALFVLLVVSTAAFLWQQEIQSYPAAVLNTWSGVVADQAALSGIEYATVMLQSGKEPHGTQTIPVPGGICKLTFDHKQDRWTIRSEAHVKAGRGDQTAVYVMSK